MVHFHKTTRLSQRSSTATSRVAQNAVKDRLLNGNRIFMFAHVRILVSILSVLCALCGQSLAQEWKTVADGIEYAEVRREFSGKPVNINLLRLDLKKVRLDVHHAMDAAIGTEKTSSIATRHNAFAAINAGFFRLDTSIWAGEAAGLLKVDGKVWSESSKDRVAIIISNKLTETRVGMTQLNTYTALKVGKKESKVWGINRELEEKDLVAFTPDFHTTTLTRPGVLEVIVAGGKVIKISDGGSSLIPTNGFVIAGTSGYHETLRDMKVGTKVSLVTSLRRPESAKLSDWDIITALVYYIGSEDIVAGVPQLIKNSKIDITWEQEKSSKAFVETRHPRTAVAKLKDGKFLMLTADGRTEQSAGLDLYDLAAYFLELGATDAMNLDGGGSTTMFLDGKVVNKPSDPTGERKVGDAILVTLRKPVKAKK